MCTGEVSTRRSCFYTLISRRYLKYRKMCSINGGVHENTNKINTRAVMVFRIYIYLFFFFFISVRTRKYSPIGFVDPTDISSETVRNARCARV